MFMSDILTLGAFFSALILPALSIAQKTVPKINVQACAIFTREGQNLQAIVTPETVELTIGSAASPAIFALPSGVDPRPQMEANRGCTLVLNSAHDEAAIGVPSAIKLGDGSISLMVSRLDLKQMRWSKPIQINPAPPLKTYFDGRYRNDINLIGYIETSAELLVVTSDNRASLIKASDEVVVGIPTNLPSELFARTSINAAGNRWWSTCSERDKIFEKATSCSLVATSLFGPPKEGPRATSPLLAHEKGILQWSAPRFYIDTGEKLIFAGPAASGLHPSEFVWIADLASGSVRQIAFHSRFNDNDLTGNAALSTDSSVLAFSIGMSKLACCFVDNYISQGDRILVADLREGKQIASVSPPQKKSALGFAVDHRGTKAVLLVNWGDGWERKEFPVP
jgi:hypothetical protein